jgi:phosphatidylglycerol:prolipoprotein diacylglycerol transferase
MHPIFLRLGPIEIRYYGLMYVISFVLGYFIIRHEARRRKLFSKPDDVLDLLLIVIPLGIIAARLYFVAFQWDWYRDAPWEIVMVWHGGLAIHGGIIGGVLGLFAVSRWKRVRFWRLADVVVPALALGLILGRIGNFLNGDAFGTPTTLPWGVVFPPASPAGQTYPGLPLHPAMLYEAIGNLLIFGLLWKLRTRPAKDGFLVSVYLIAYGVVRFACEFFRGDALMLGPWRAAQVASVLLVLTFGTWLLADRLWRPARA